MATNYRTLTTFEQVCTDQGKDQSNYPIPAVQTDANGVTTNSEELALAYLRRVKLIEKAVNGDNKLDIANTNQYKWGVWAWVNEQEKTEANPAGFGLSFDGCDYDDSVAGLGVRPLFADDDRAEYAFKQFQEEFEQMMRYTALWMLE